MINENLRKGRCIWCHFYKSGWYDLFLKNEIVLFTDGDINLEVKLSPELETVWLTPKRMEELFGAKQATLSEHINNIISSGELDETSIGFSDKSSGGRKLYLRKGNADKKEEGHMRKFWGFYKNESYCVGCNGATVYIYDKDENEITKFDRGVNMDILHSTNIACAMVYAQLLD